MSTILILMTLVAMFHFVYEGIIAPSIQVGLRNKLFVVRDEIRRAKIENVEPANEEAFWYVHDGINGWLTRIPLVTLTNQFAAIRAYRTEPELRKNVDMRVALVKGCSDDRVKAAKEKASFIIWEASIANSGGWLVYLVPIAVVLATFKNMKRFATGLLLSPEKTTEKLMARPC